MKRKDKTEHQVKEVKISSIPVVPNRGGIPPLWRNFISSGEDFPLFSEGTYSL